MKKFAKIVTVVLVLASVVGACFALSACNKDQTAKIGAQSGTTGELYLKGNADMGFSGFSNIEAKGYDSIGQAVQDMINGNLKCVVGDIEPAKAAVSSISGTKVIDIPLSSEEYAIGVDKNQPQLLADINAIIADIKENGTLDQIIANYNDENYTPVGVTAGTYDPSKNQLVVATNADFKPFEYIQGELFVGIDIEIAKIIATTLNMELVIRNIDFDAVVTSVGKNGVDVALAGLTITETRKVSVTFSDSYFTDSYQVLIVKEGDTTFDNCTTKEQIEAILKSM